MLKLCVACLGLTLLQTFPSFNSLTMLVARRFASSHLLRLSRRGWCWDD